MRALQITRSQLVKVGLATGFGSVALGTAVMLAAWAGVQDGADQERNGIEATPLDPPLLRGMEEGSDAEESVEGAEEEDAAAEEGVATDGVAPGEDAPLDPFADGEEEVDPFAPAVDPFAIIEEGPTWPRGDAVMLRALDKITARFRDIEVAIDEPLRFGTLEIVARACSKRPPEETPETTAFLEIFDFGVAGYQDEPASVKDKEKLFSGWMFASSPALNPLEHSIYDVWVIDCRIAAPGTGAAEPAPETAAPIGTDVATGADIPDNE